jgi:PAS domain S-box-containing protein
LYPANKLAACEGKTPLLMRLEVEQSETANALQILHVDPNTCLLKTSKQLREILGDFQIVTASSVDEAMTKIRKDTYDVVISEYDFPLKDGLQLLREMRNEGISTLFILFTAAKNEHIAVEALNLGANGYFTKLGNPENVYCNLAQGVLTVLNLKKTEHTLAERDLKVLAERYMTLADSLPEVIFETDLTGKLTYVNRKALEITGYTMEDYSKGVYNFQFFAPKDLERAKATYTNAMINSTPTRNEYNFVRKDGSEFPAIIEGIPIKSQNKTVGMRGLVIDLTTQKRITEKLTLQGQLLDAVGQAVIATDKNRLISYWNKGAKKLYGWSSTEAIGQNIDDLLYGFSPDEVSEISARLRKGEAWSSESLVKHRDGSEVPVLVNRYPVINEAGEFIGAISVYTDITDQKYLEHELAGYINELANSSEKIKLLNEKLRVLGGLTRHDIRNKLAAFNGYTYLLKKKIGNDQSGLDLLVELEKASKQILDILEFERIYEQVGSEDLTFVNVSKFFAEAAALVTDRKGVNLKCACEGLEVKADSLLRQVLYNLIDNTLKYGAKVTSINLYSKKETDNLLLIYEDNGVGITDEIRGHLFEKGFGRGTGIGLYLIKRIIDAYGWIIEENGEPGVGAKFTMKISLDGFRTKN